MPVIDGAGGKKLSKRREAVSVMWYRDDGYLKEVVMNYLVGPGWSHGDWEAFSIEEMIKKIDIDEINKSSSSLYMEKMQWLNQYFIKPEQLAEEFLFLLSRPHWMCLMAQIWQIS